jgi:hypothetical protein
VLTDAKVAYLIIALGGLLVACLLMDPRLACSNLADGKEFLRVIKIRSTTSFGDEVKPSVPCKIYGMLKNPASIKEIFRLQNSATISRQVSPISQLDISADS